LNQAAGPNDTTVTRRLRVETTRAPDPGIPVRMLVQGIQRLRIVVGVIVLLTLIGWLGVNAIEGDLGDEFHHPGDLLPPTIGLAASLGLLLMTPRPGRGLGGGAVDGLLHGPGPDPTTPRPRRPDPVGGSRAVDHRRPRPPRGVVHAGSAGHAKLPGGLRCRDRSMTIHCRQG